MIRVSRWTTAALAAAFLLPSLLIASTRVLQAQPAGREKVTPTAALPGSPDRSSLGETNALTQDDELRQSARNLREIMSTIHTYHDVAGHFPMAKSGWGYDEKTKEWFRQRPYLSWRVLLLPLLGEKKLFERFRMGEPWNSEHNRKLIPLIPTIYRAPGSKTVEGRTNYLGAVGPNAAFPNKSAIMVPDFTDGTSNTIMLVEVPDTAAVEWTRPKDFPADTDGPVTKLVGLRKGGFLTAFADGAPQFISDSIAPETLRCLLHRNDGLLIGASESIHFVRPATAPAVNAE